LANGGSYSFLFQRLTSTVTAICEIPFRALLADTKEEDGARYFPPIAGTQHPPASFLPIFLNLQLN
jgi:hypothetical protein